MSDTQTPKWYIATSIIGNEDVVYKNIEDKIRAYDLTDYVKEIKLLKTREITIEVFDNKNNPPPKSMRNTKTITWETLPGNKYKKTRIREINRFPGYIYIKMIMTQEVWYAIRNTYGITGFVGSSGKGAQPIPMSDFEVEKLFDPSNNADIVIDRSDSFNNVYVENTVEANETPKENKVEFLSKPEIVGVSNKPFVTFVDPSDIDYFDSTKVNNDVNVDNESQSNLENEISNNDIKDTIIDESNEDHTSIFLEEDNEDDSNLQDNASLDDRTDDNEYKVGMQVKIIDGGMKDSVGYIVSINNLTNQASIEIELLGRKQEVLIDLKDLSKNLDD